MISRACGNPGVVWTEHSVLANIKVECRNQGEKKLSESEIRPRVYKTFFILSIQLSMKFLQFINVKMPKIIGISIFISRINASSESFKERKICVFQQFS